MILDFKVLCIVILAIWFMYSICDAVRYSVKLSYLFLQTELWSFVLLLPSIFTFKSPTNFLNGSWLVQKFLSLIPILKYEIHGIENIPVSESCIFVANHQSALDVFGSLYIWQYLHPCVPVMKREVLFTGPFGIFSWLAGAIFLDRSNPKEAKEKLNLSIEKLKHQKVNLLIFPEGTRNGSVMLPFKKGAFHMAVQNQLAIVPVVFSNYDSFYNPIKKYFNTGIINVTFLPAVRTTGLNGENVSHLLLTVRTSMLKCFNGEN